MSKASTIDDPYYSYDPLTNQTDVPIEASGIQIMSIDNLPTEMPLEASEFFSDALSPVIKVMVRSCFYKGTRRF
jgi:alpha-aminoadipic semialdehyde synthase